MRVSLGSASRSDRRPDAQSGLPRVEHRDTAHKAYPLLQSVYQLPQKPQFQFDRYNLSMIAFFDLRSYLRFIYLIATASKFLFAVVGFSNCHGPTIIATIAFHFNPGNDNYSYGLHYNRALLRIGNL